MLRTLEGVYRGGKVEIKQAPDDVRDETRVLVTFLEPNLIASSSKDDAYAIDNEIWESQFRETSEAQWDKLADLARQEIAAGDVVPLEDILSKD